MVAEAKAPSLPERSFSPKMKLPARHEIRQRKSQPRQDHQLAAQQGKIAAPPL
jgi:hypothetical protein